MCITAHLRGCRLFLGCAPAKRMARWPKLAANEGETGVEIHERGSSSTAKASRRIDFSGAFTRDYRLVGDARSITRIVMATEMAPNDAPSNCQERVWDWDDIVIVFGLWPPKKLNQELDNSILGQVCGWEKAQTGSKNAHLKFLLFKVAVGRWLISCWTTNI